MQRQHFLRTWPKPIRSVESEHKWIWKIYAAGIVLGLVVPWAWNTWRG